MYTVDIFDMPVQYHINSFPKQNIIYPTTAPAPSQPSPHTRARRSHTLNYGAYVRESAGQHRVRDSLAPELDEEVCGGGWSRDTYICGDGGPQIMYVQPLIYTKQSLRRLSLSSRGGQQQQPQPPIEEEEEGGKG